MKRQSTNKMSKLDFREFNLNALIHAAGRLKLIERAGWIKKGGIARSESVADHSFRMAIIGMLLSEEMRLDRAKIIRMCLIHDLAESVIGDLMPEEKESIKSHHMEELRVLKLILSSLPERSRRMLNADVSELMNEESFEAKLTWQIDKLEMSLQQLDYLKAGYDRKKLSQFNLRKDLSRSLQLILDQYNA